MTTSSTKTEQPKQKAPDVKPAAPVSEGMEQSFSHEDVTATLKNLESARPETILRLQRVAGNRAVTNMLGRNATPPAPPAFKAKAGFAVQTKSLMVSTPGDAQEMEADQVSEQIMKMPDKTVSAPPDEDENNNGGNAILNRYLQRNAIQRSSEDGIGGNAVSEDVQSRIDGMQQGGQPLPASEREFFEPRMGVDLSNVRVHTDSTAADTSKELNARAYTVGPHVAFNSGEFQPGTTEGRKLLGHELTHVVQQGGAVARKPIIQREASIEDAVAEAQKEVTEEDVAKEKDAAKVESKPADVPADNKVDDKAAAATESAPGASAVPADAAPAPAKDTPKDGAGAPATAEAAQAQTPNIASVAVDKAATPDAVKTPAEQAPTAEKKDGAAAATQAGASKPVAGSEKTVGEAKPAAPTASAQLGAPTQQPAAVKDAGAATAQVGDKVGTPPTQQPTGVKEPGTTPTQTAAPSAQMGEKPGAPAQQPADVKEPGATVTQATATPTQTGEKVSGAGAVAPSGTKDDPALPATATSAAGGSMDAKAAETAPGAVPDSASSVAAGADIKQTDKPGVAIEDEDKTKLVNRMPINGVVQRYQAPKSAQEDPAFQKVVSNSKAAAEKEKQHEPAHAEAAKAQAAADPKGTDVDMAAQGRQVGEMQQQPTGGFDAAAFKAKLLANIDKAAPTTLKEAEDFKSHNRVDEVKQSVVGDVKNQKEQAEGKLEEKAEAQPDKSGLKGKEVAPLQQAPADGAPTDIGAQGAAPKSKGAEEVEAPIKEQSNSLDKQMADARITDEQLQKSNEPSFNKALVSKKTAQENAEQAPKDYRKDEQSTLIQAQGDAKTTADAKAQDTRSERQKLMDEVFSAKGGAKGVDEGKRQEVAGAISDIYLQTKTDVEKILSGMDAEVDSRFNEGAKQAQEAFEKTVDSELSDYKNKRYLSRLDGLLLWAEDLFKGLPEDANYVYTDGRKVYLQKMDECLGGIAKYVADQLNAAKTRIAEGQKQIQTYVTGLSPDLQKIGAEAADQIQGKFSELSSSVDSKQDELVDSLTQKYNDKLKEIDARIEEMKQQNSGLINQAQKAIGDVIETIKKLADMLMQTLKNAAGAVQKILDDPITFLSNLLEAVKKGFMQFVGNIGKYLSQGLIDWLVGAIGSAGITLPKALDDLPGIFNMVLDILGLTYQNIRGKVVEALGPQGETIVSGLEKAWEIFKVIKDKGLAGVWEMIQGMIGDLKTMVMDQIKQMVMGEVIEAGVKWLVSLLGGPAGAFIKAVEGIVNVVTWFINNGQRIMGIVNGIISSITSIANGDISGAANFIEGILAKSVPTMISFLADLLGLGGIAEKVQGIIKKIQEPINKAINWIVQKAMAMGKAIMGKLGFGKKKEEGGEDGAGENDPKVQAGLNAIETREAQEAKNGELSRDGADKVANDVKQEHPIFKSIAVVDDGKRWAYDYQIQRTKKESTLEKEGGDNIEELARMQAKRLIAAATQEAPIVSNALESSVAQYGGKLVGLENQLKSEDSLTRKIADRANEALSKKKYENAEAAVVAIAETMNDALRYTVETSTENYASVGSSIKSSLESAGFKYVKGFNAWAAAGTSREMAYRGINTTFASPSGLEFELQFHTVESYGMKTNLHSLYEEWRAATTTKARKKELEALMKEKWNTIPTPEGAKEWK